MMALVPAWLWRDSVDALAHLSPLQIAVRRFVRSLIAVARDSAAGRHGLYAASLVYTTLLALAPLLAIAFSVIKGVGGIDTLEPFLRQILLPLGPSGLELIPRLVEFVNNINVGVLGAVGFLFLVFSVLSLMNKVEAAFNVIWRVVRPRSFFARIRDHLGVLLIGPLFIFLSMGMTAGLRYEDTIGRWFGITGLDAVWTTALSVVPWVLFTFAFTALYILIPNTRVRLVPALVAGALTALAWKALGALFALFVTTSGAYAAIYSAFAALVLFMLWLYMAWLIVLAGASVAYYLQYPERIRLGAAPGIRSMAQERALALLVAADISRRFSAQPQMSTHTASIAGAWHIPVLDIEGALDHLVAAHLVVSSDQGYVPARPFDAVTVSQAVQLIDGAGAGDGMVWPRPINDVLQAFARAQDQGLAGETLAQLGRRLADVSNA